MPIRRLIKKYPRCGCRDEVDMKEIRLYDYQAEMKERIDTAFRSYQSVMVQMPTGTGKTILLAEVVKREKLKGKNPWVWIVVHRRELVEQIRETLDTMLSSPSSTPDTTSPLLSENSRIKVMSIQWLSRHYQDMAEKPSLIVIDEAHHAVAKTYKEVMDAFSEAKKLGLTATPCRLTRRGFTDLFDVLLMSWSAKRFIAIGRLSLYDYMSIKADSEDQRRILGLTKRGADGDFSLKEMSEKLDVRPSIKRLCETVLRYAADKKGITYAIDITHAEHIAEEYRRHGIMAVAISSKTPLAERKAIIERFKGTGIGDCNDKPYYASLGLTKPLGETLSADNKADVRDKTLEQTNDIQVLVNVDLFGEGFDCPDVEFIQLARPTLSLAKYLQQVGRGMRVFEGKKYCLILDNVGLYRLFGLPSDDRDWQAMFEGKIAGKGNIIQTEEQYEVAYSIRNKMVSITSDNQTELITVMTHDGQRMDLEAAYGYEIVENEDGLSGVVDKEGNNVLPCIYNKVELKAYGFATLYSRKKIDRERPWIDLLNGVRFIKRPKIKKIGFLEFSTTDGLRFYPRVRTRQMDESCFVLAESLEHGIDYGLRFKTFYVQPSEPDKLYSFKEKMDDVQLWEDENGNLAWKEEFETSLHPTSQDEWETRKKKHSDEIKKYARDVHQYIWHFNPQIQIDSLFRNRLLKDNKELDIRLKRKADGSYQTYCRELSFDKWKSVGAYLKVFPQAYGIRVVQKQNGKYVVRTRMFEPLETPEHEYEFAELQDNVLLHFVEKGKDYWTYLENNVCFSKKPEIVSIGVMNFLKVEDVYVEMSPNNRKTYRRDEIRMRNGICFLGNKNVLIESKYWSRYFIYRRYVDGKRFILSDNKEVEECDALYDLYYDGENPPIFKKRKKSYEL